MELERILHRHGFGSRKRCRMLVRAGRVAVHGVACDDPFIDLPTAELVFSVDNQPWPYREKASLVMHKPAGHECSRRPMHHPSVYTLLPSALQERGVQSVGRLDEDTTGLLLFTDDGQLNHALTSPKRKIAKVYLVRLKHAVEPALVETLLQGVLLHDESEVIAAADCVAVDEHLLKLTVTEGKYHQVKRMIAAAGNRVEALHRQAVGGLCLPTDLLPGQWRWLDDKDLATVVEPV